MGRIPENLHHLEKIVQPLDEQIRSRLGWSIPTLPSGIAEKITQAVRNQEPQDSELELSLSDSDAGLPRIRKTVNNWSSVYPGKGKIMTIGLINSKEESFVDKYCKNEFPDLFYDCKLFSSSYSNSKTWTVNNLMNNLENNF